MEGDCGVYEMKEMLSLLNDKYYKSPRQTYPLFPCIAESDSNSGDRKFVIGAF